MTRRTIVVVLATAVLALLHAAAAPPPAGAVGFVDKQVQAGGLLIQNYINAYGISHGFIFPARSLVMKGGGLEDATRIWPSNPWTGKLMAPGTARGAYTYGTGTGGISYRLVMHLSSGNYVFKGSMPRWLRAERDIASKQNLLLLQQYVEAVAGASHVYPATGSFTSGADPAYAWPVNPWTKQAMTLAGGLGDYSFVQKASGAGYELTTRLSNGDVYKLMQLPVGAPLLTAPTG